jgi:hypothetical protein
MNRGASTTPPLTVVRTPGTPLDTDPGIARWIAHHVDAGIGVGTVGDPTTSGAPNAISDTTSQVFPIPAVSTAAVLPECHKPKTLKTISRVLLSMPLNGFGLRHLNGSPENGHTAMSEHVIGLDHKKFHRRIL